MGLVLGPHARTDRTRDTRVAEPWLPAPEGGWPGEGQRLTPDAPHNGGRPPPPGTTPHHPRGTQPPQGMQAKGTVLGPHTHTPAPTARGSRTPTARPAGGQTGEGQRLSSDAPHTIVESTPPGDALLPPPQRATPARKGALCGAAAGSPRPHGPQPGQTGRRSPAARSRGRAAGGGTAPDTRRPSQWWKAPPLGTPFPPTPQRAAPARKGAHCGDVAGFPGPHRPHPGHTGSGTLAARSRGRAAGGGTAPDTRRPSVLVPHTHTAAPTARGWRTPTARPVGGQSGERQRLTSDAPHNGGRHHPRGRPSATPTASNAGPQGRTLWGRCWVPTPAPTAPGTHGSQNPGCPLQRTGVRGRDSA